MDSLCIADAGAVHAASSRQPRAKACAGILLASLASSRRSRGLRLTELSNVVAYACRPSSRKDRHDVHHHRRFASVHDALRQPSARPWLLKKDRRKGRKGRKPRIRRKDGPCRRCREAAETGGNRRKLAGTGFCGPMATGKYSWKGWGIGQFTSGNCGKCGNPLAVPRPAITLRITVGSARSVMPSTVHRLVSATVSSRWNGTGHAQAVQHRLHLLELKIGRALQRNKEAGGNAPSCRIR
jgi:hypothetical protein